MHWSPFNLVIHESLFKQKGKLLKVRFIVFDRYFETAFAYLVYNRIHFPVMAQPFKRAVANLGGYKVVHDAFPLLVTRLHRISR